MTLLSNDFSRRRFLAGSVVLATAAMVFGPARALDTDQARALIDRLVNEINGVINSGKSETAMYLDFEQIFAKYAFVSGIARTVLGPPARSASSAELGAYTLAFRGYIGRKYGKRFREFIGGGIVVKDAKKLKSFYQVNTSAILAGMAPFELTFMVSDVSGKDLFFDMLIEGISLLKVEKTEIGAMLDRRRGNLGMMTEDLKKAG
ncbi:MAG: MlaC/ttg2D family ABC transporter substrate-binding protein [Paracoccaceae bacterium]